MRPIQKFSREYLEQVRYASPEAILHYLEEFRLMQDQVIAKINLSSNHEKLLGEFSQQGCLEGQKEA